METFAWGVEGIKENQSKTKYFYSFVFSCTIRNMGFFA